MLIKPIPFQFIARHELCPFNLLLALSVTTMTLKWSIHLPFGGRVEKGKRVTLAKGSVRHDPDLHLVHVKVDRGVAGMITVQQIGVQLNVIGATGLHR